MKAMPAIFIGHGDPKNAIQDTIYTRRWKAIGEALPHPKAILSISAHWYVAGTPVTAMDWPRTIHDFGAFPEDLHRFQYVVPGDARLARRVQQLLAPLVEVSLDTREWGLDHGTWAVLRHMYPSANVPVVQLGIDYTKPPEHHFAIGRALMALRDEGVLIVGSGNLVHNLHTAAWGRPRVEPSDCGLRFETSARALIMSGELEPLLHYEGMGNDALLSVPTPDHFLPLLYVLGAHRRTDEIAFPVEGFDGDSVSMLAVQLG